MSQGGPAPPVREDWVLLDLSSEWGSHLGKAKCHLLCVNQRLLGWNQMLRAQGEEDGGQQFHSLVPSGASQLLTEFSQ